MSSLHGAPSGRGVLVGVGVTVGVTVGVSVGVAVGVTVGVSVGVAVGVIVAVEVGVAGKQGDSPPPGTQAAGPGSHTIAVLLLQIWVQSAGDAALPTRKQPVPWLQPQQQVRLPRDTPGEETNVKSRTAVDSLTDHRGRRGGIDAIHGRID